MKKHYCKHCDTKLEDGDVRTEWVCEDCEEHFNPLEKPIVNLKAIFTESAIKELPAGFSDSQILCNNCRVKLAFAIVKNRFKRIGGIDV